MADSRWASLSEKSYFELRHLAARLMRKEYRVVTLSATALLHEALLRWSPAQDQRILPLIMRHVLIDYARRRAVLQKHLDQQAPAEPAKLHPADQLAVQQALQKLARLDQRQAAVVELRVTAGLSLEEISLRLGCSVRTAQRDWMTARRWLQRELSATVLPQ